MEIHHGGEVEGDTIHQEDPKEEDFIREEVRGVSEIFLIIKHLIKILIKLII